MSTHSELIALYREGILSGEELRRSLAALNTVIEQQAAAPAPQAKPAPPPAPPIAPAPGTGRNAKKNAKKRAAKKAGKAAPVSSGAALAPPAAPTQLTDTELEQILADNGFGPEPPAPPPTEHVFKEAEIARGWSAWDWEAAPITDEERTSVEVFLTNATPATVKRLNLDIRERGAVKVAISVEVEYEKYGEEKTMSFHHQAKNGVILTPSSTRSSKSLPPRRQSSRPTRAAAGG